MVGVVAGIGTAFIAASYNNINDYLQTLFSFFQAPVFITFILGMFWKRTTPWGGFWGMLSRDWCAAGVWFAPCQRATSSVRRSNRRCGWASLPPWSTSLCRSS